LQTLGAMQVSTAIQVGPTQLPNAHIPGMHNWTTFVQQRYVPTLLHAPEPSSGGELQATDMHIPTSAIPDAGLIGHPPLH
jgi:hypothetical protein